VNTLLVYSLGVLTCLSQFSIHQLGETAGKGGFQGVGLDCPRFYSLGLFLFVQQACLLSAVLFKERYSERELTESAVDDS